MQNIDPILLAQPIVLIAFSAATILYWRWKEGFPRIVLAFSLLAYGGAILAKAAFQYVTAPSILTSSQGSPWLLGLYFGLQTAFFEVGGAFLVARFAFSHRRMRKGDEVAYGLGLAFWENGVLLGGVALISLLYYYFTLAQGGVAAQGLYSSLSTTQPELFYPPLEALSGMGWGLLERLSSFMVHLSWGYLCLRSVATQRNRYLAMALPMGFIDFLVPFVQLMTVPIFEIVIFMLASFCILVAVYASKP